MVGRVVAVAFSIALTIVVGSPCRAADDAAKTFDVWEYRVDGNTVLDARDVERILYPYLGPMRDLGGIEQARGALEAEYRARGYVAVAVTIPEQTVDRGLVRLQVVEQHVAKLRVTGAKYTSERDIAGAMPSLAPGEVLNSNDVQKDIAALSARSRDVQYDPRIKSGKDVGTLDVEVAVKDRPPLHGSLELNNFRSANTTDLRTAATVSYENLFQRQQELILSSQVSPQDTSEVKVFSGTYVVRPDNGNIFSATGVHTDSDVAAVGGTTVLGKGDFAFVRGLFPLRQNANLRDNLILGFDYKSSKDETTFLVDNPGGPSTTDVSDKRITYVNLVTGYDAAVNGWGGPTTVDVTANFGSRQLANNPSEFEKKRFKGDPNYLHLNLEASHTQPLPLGMHLVARVRGQWSQDALIANEEFNVGGATSVRGYLESEQLADYGVGTSFELVTPNLGARLGRLSTTEGYVFWDWSNGRLNDPLPKEKADFRMASVGAGVRFAAIWGFEGDAFWAHTLNDAPDTPSGDDRMSFRFGYTF